MVTLWRELKVVLEGIVTRVEQVLAIEFDKREEHGKQKHYHIVCCSRILQ